MRPTWHSRAPELAVYLAAALLTALAAVPLLDLFQVQLGVPLGYKGDALSVGVHVKNVLERGWIDLNPFVGAPAGSHGNDFPGADNLHLLVIAALGVFSSSYPIVLNAYYLLTFPLAAVAGAWFFRVVGVGRALTVALAVLYAFAPYHFSRGEDHLYLAAYYPVPLALVLVYRAVSGEALWSQRADPAPRWRARLTGRNTANAGVLLLLGTASSYYSVFTLLLLTLCALIALAQDRRVRTLAGVVVAQVVLAGVMVVNMLPNLLYERAHGSNVVALVRNARSSEVYDFKLASLLLPTPFHRIAAFAAFRRSYDGTFPLPSERPALGAVGALGLIVLLALAVVSIVRRPATDAGESAVWTAQRRLAVLALLALLLGTVGGLSTFFALFVTDSLRGWNRLSIFVSAISLAAVGLMVGQLLGRPAVTRVLRRPWLGPLLAAGFLAVVGLYDQTPPANPSGRAAVVLTWNRDQAFVAAVEARLPRHGLVFQLPYMFFPESHPIVAMADSDQFRFYLHSHGLRWSYGGIRGRAAADWAPLIAGQPVDRMAELLAAGHVDGLEVYRAGYTDQGRSLENQLRRFLHVTPLVSGGGQYSFWDLRPYTALLRRRSTTAVVDAIGQHVLLHPVGYPLGFPGSQPRLVLDNGWPYEQPADLRLTLIRPPDGSDVLVTLPGGNQDRVSFTGPTSTVSRRLLLAPGRSTLNIRSVTGATVRLGSLNVDDPVLEGFRP